MPRLGQTGAVLALLLSACAIYEPTVLDCSITCGAREQCPASTTCNGGFCRPPSASGLCDCREGEERPCGTERGVCVAGVQRCVGNAWTVCLGAMGPSLETCNGLDDDCDGAIDDEVSPRSCALTRGVCQGSLERCADGAWRGCDSSSYGPSYERHEQRCDGRDNDCDGRTDITGDVVIGLAVEGTWSFRSTADGFVFVQARDGGVEVAWLDETLEREDVQLRAGVLLATSVDGEALVLASMTDAGVELARLQRDGGSVVRVVPEWATVDRLQLGGTLAAASLDGSVQLALLEDAGAPAVIALATDFELEAGGRALALPTAILEPRTGAMLRDAGAGPLSALLAPSDSVLVGVPRDQPGPPVVFPNLLVDDRLELFAIAPLPRLSLLTGTVHAGRVVLGGATDFQLWALTSTGARTLELAPLRVQVTSGAGATFGVAWQVGDRVSAARFCDP